MNQFYSTNYKRVIKVLKRLHDSCGLQIMSFRDFPLQYEMMGAPQRFLSVVVDFLLGAISHAERQPVTGRAKCS